MKYHIEKNMVQETLVIPLSVQQLSSVRMLKETYRTILTWPFSLS